MNRLLTGIDRTNLTILITQGHFRWIYRKTTPIYNLLVLKIHRTTTPASQDQLKRLLSDGSAEALWLAKHFLSTLISVFLTGFHYYSYQVTTQLSSKGWVDPVLDPILPEKFLWYSQELKPGPLGWQSSVLTTLPNRRFILLYQSLRNFVQYSVFI